MTRLLFPPLIFALAATTGCSLFSSPTPSSNVHLGRSGIDKDGSLVRDADIFEVPNVWATENVVVELDETYDTSSGTSELLQSRSIKITRLTDPAKAADVAIIRAMQTERVTEAGLAAVATVGAAAIAGPAAGGTAEGLTAILNAIGRQFSKGNTDGTTTTTTSDPPNPAPDAKHGDK